MGPVIEEDAMNGRTSVRTIFSAGLLLLFAVLLADGASSHDSATAFGDAAASIAAFPGVNGKIAFTSDRDGDKEIYVMNSDGTNQTNLSNNVTNDEAPA